jgi:serine/threonine protein kinase
LNYDFFYFKKGTNLTSKVGGTENYMAPELNNGMISPSADSFSFGVFYLFLLNLLFDKNRLLFFKY